MPFTLSHAAAVLPLIRRDGTARGPLIPSALVAGSFAPDLTYFADSLAPGAAELGDFTHSLPGVLSADIAVTAVLAAAWLLLREPLVALLPGSWQGRTYLLLRGSSWRGRRPFALAWRFCLSAALGAATHVVWDAFTHLDRWGMRVFPVLGKEIAGSPMYWYAQYGGSAVALAVVALFLWSALRRVRVPAEGLSLLVLSPRERWLARSFLVLCGAVGIVHRATRWLAHVGDDFKPWEIIPTVCFGAGAGLSVGLLLYAAAVRLRRRATAPPAAADRPHRPERTRPTPR
ncbi:DUF4184 family protein [Streptomyces sp. T-3]|nr:DUF4184 family protein [Streptomyces sp. T-3]